VVAFSQETHRDTRAISHPAESEGILESAAI
jgi:hypothetical protein